jgi:putative ABC transport system permease protein
LLRNDLAANVAIVDLATSCFTFGEGWAGLGYDADDGTYRTFALNIIDEDYLPTFGMEIVAGRNFSREISSDVERALIVNEAFVAEYGWDNALGQRLPGESFEDHEIIGVVKDFNFASLHGAVTPLVLVINPRLVLRGASDVGFSSAPTPKIAVRIKPDDIQGTLATLEQSWKRIAPDQPYNYSFVDETLNNQYRQEERLGEIVSLASMLAIVIACLGLFGLAALAVARRT